MKSILNRLGLYLFAGCISITSLYAEDIGAKTVTISQSGVIEVSPHDRGFYIGVGSGIMKLKDDFTKEYFQTNPILLQLGYEFNPHFALEGRYIRDMGKVKYENGTTLSSDDDDFPTVFSNTAIYLKFIYPTDGFSLYTLLGYGEVSLTDIRGDDRAESGFQWGIGLSYSLSENVELFTDYGCLYSGKGFDGRATQRDVNVNIAIVGVKYIF